MVPVSTRGWGDRRLLVPKGNNCDNEGDTRRNGIDPELGIYYYVCKEDKEKGWGWGGVGVGWGWVGGGTHHSFDITSAVDNVGSKDLYDGKTNGIC